MNTDEVKNEYGLAPKDYRGGKTVTECTQNAIWHLQQAQKRNSAMQEKHKAGTPEWHNHESIDDRLHDALSEMGQ